MLFAFAPSGVRALKGRGSGVRIRAAACTAAPQQRPSGGVEMQPQASGRVIAYSHCWVMFPS